MLLISCWSHLTFYRCLFQNQRVYYHILENDCCSINNIIAICKDCEENERHRNCCLGTDQWSVQPRILSLTVTNMWWFRGRNTHSQLCYSVPQREISFWPQMVLSLCLKAWGLIAIVNFTLASVTKLDCSLLSVTCPSPGLHRITVFSLTAGFITFTFAVLSRCSNAIQRLVPPFYMSHTLYFSPITVWFNAFS